MGLIFARNIILVTVLTCYIIGQCAGQTIDVCSDMETEVRLCYQLYQPFLYTDLNQSWTQNCQNVECFLQCMADAIRDCDSTDRYFTYDINLLIVSYRAACDKFQINVNALISCELYNYTCLMVSGAMAFAQNASVLYDSSRYVEYKQAYCEYLRHSTACLQSHESGNCTTELADYYGEFLRVSALPKGCGLPQDHAYFTTYGGPPRCITPYTFETSSETPLQSTFSTSSQTNRSDSTLYSTSDTTSETPLQSTFSAISQTNQSDSTLYSSPVTTYTPLSSSTASPNIDCSSVESDFEKCYQLYLSAAQEGDITSVWFQVCQNTECFLQCMIDAIGECDTTDKYFQYDVDVQIVFYRSICNQFNLTVNAMTLCELDNTTCSMISGETEFFQNASDFYGSGRYLEFRQAQCEYLNRSTECLEPNGSGECTTELAEIAYGIRRVLASLKGCGQPHDHPYFTTYGGPLNCITPHTFETSSETPPSTNSVPPSSSISTPSTDSTSSYLLTTPVPTFSATDQTNHSDSTLPSSPVTTNIPPSLSTASSNINCSSVDSDLLICYQLYQPIQYVNLTSTWLQNCQNIECFLQCMSDAIGDCDTTNKYFSYDMNVQIVSYRAACNHFDLNINALTSCHLLNTSCLMSNGAAAVAQQAASYFSSGEYTHYKEAACNYTRLSTDCIQPELTGNCTVDMSNFYEGLLRVSGSLAHCGNPQDHVFFQTYGGSLNCILPNTIGLSDTTNPLSTSTTSLPSTATLLSSTLQTTTTSLLTTAMILSSTPETTTTSLPTTSTPLSSTPQTTTTSLPTTATPLSSTPQTTTTSLPTTATPLSSTPQTTTTSQPTTSTPLSSTPQTETTSLPTTATLLFSPSQTTTTPRSVPTSKTTTASPLGCSGSVIAAGLAKCFTISLDQISSTYDLLTSYCSDLECNIQCYINAVGQCYTEDQFFVYDTEVYKVTSRAFCNNINETLFSLLNCQMTNLSCLTALTNGIQTYAFPAFNAQDYTTYRQTYCTALTSFQSCVAFAASESCTSTMALQALDFYVASTSYWKCSLQNHEYFTTYGEDVTCSAVTTTWGIVIMIALLAVLLCI